MPIKLCSEEIVLGLGNCESGPIQPILKCYICSLHGHRVNLLVLDACKIVKNTRIVFNCLELLYVYFSLTTTSIEYCDMQTKLGIKATVTSMTFIVHLFILEEVLHIINVLSTRLQQKSSTSGNAANLIDTYKKAISDESWDKLWIDVKKFIKLNGSSVEGLDSTRGTVQNCYFCS